MRRILHAAGCERNSTRVLGGCDFTFCIDKKVIAGGGTSQQQAEANDAAICDRVYPW